MDEKQLEYFKELLLEERKNILDNLMNENETLSELKGGDEGDLADQAYTHYEKKLVLDISKTEQETLKKIDKALKRIDSGDYGLCEVCKEEIEYERLEVIPYTTLCIKHSRMKAKRRGR